MKKFLKVIAFTGQESDYRYTLKMLKRLDGGRENTFISQQMQDFLNGKMDDSYLSIFSGVRNYYCSLEQKALEKAKDYPPLFVTQAKNAHSAGAALATTAPENSDEQENIIMLSLSKKGRDGANIREQASAKSKIITTVSGKAALVYLKQEGNWVLVETEDGKTGWIKFDLVDGIPE